MVSGARDKTGEGVLGFLLIVSELDSHPSETTGALCDNFFLVMCDLLLGAVCGAPACFDGF